MNLRQFRTEEPAINLTPLIDVVFLLLIFFMVTTTFREESKIEINLPQASDKPTISKESQLEIIIDRDGRYYVDRKLVINTQLDTLKHALRKSVGENEDPLVIISADADAPHHSVITAMDAARQTGLIRLSIATKQLNSEK